MANSSLIAADAGVAKSEGFPTHIFTHFDPKLRDGADVEAEAHDAFAPKILDPMSARARLVDHQPVQPAPLAEDQFIGCLDAVPGSPFAAVANLVWQTFLFVGTLAAFIALRLDRNANKTVKRRPAARRRGRCSNRTLSPLPTTAPGIGRGQPKPRNRLRLRQLCGKMPALQAMS